eukprot:10609876-Ditylum_brightwellii.AAC.1
MYDKLRKDNENQVKGIKMKVGGNVHSLPDGTSSLKTTAGLPPVYPNKKVLKKTERNLAIRRWEIQKTSMAEKLLVSLVALRM